MYSLNQNCVREFATAVGKVWIKHLWKDADAFFRKSGRGKTMEHIKAPWFFLVIIFFYNKSTAITYIALHQTKMLVLQEIVHRHRFG